MRDQHIVIVGGGLAGLSAGCYARAAGFRATILEHNLALGGVCTSWSRGEYTVDGCIHWLTGGSFDQLYEELGIFPAVKTRVIETFAALRDVAAGTELRVTRNLETLACDLEHISHYDTVAIGELIAGARAVAELKSPLDAPELRPLRDRIHGLWELRGELPVMLRFRKPLGEWAAEHVRSEALRNVLLGLMPPEAPAVALLGLLGWLERGALSRPVGGTAAFRDALIGTYERLGGVAQTNATVDEILVRGDHACGVRLADGTEVEADAVICTSSTPETVFRLLGGRYGAEAARERMAHWKLFDPIVLASYGVKHALEGLPAMIQFRGLEPLEIGGVRNTSLAVRVCNDDPSFAPPGRSVVQVLARTDYDWWAGRGNRYGAEKDAVAARVAARLATLLPETAGAIEMVDVATPLTYWRTARSWRGAYEAWMPNAEGLFGHVERTLKGLSGLYLAGQWVEPGGGVPTALASGRSAVQLLCADTKRAFVPRPADVTAPAPAAVPRVPRDRPVLLLYATREGQTRRIAEHVAATLRSRGYLPVLRDARTDAPPSLGDYGSAIVAASVHIQRHEREVVDFVRAHREALEKLPSAFLSVSLAAAGAQDPGARPGDHEKALAQVEELARGFFDQTGWRADRVQPVAGALAYPQYAVPKRLVMKLIAASNHADTDTSRAHEYTDWAALDRFVERFIAE